MPRGDERPGIRPRQSWGRRLDIAARHAFPVSSTIVLMLLSQAPFGIADQAVLLPAFTLTCVWFWSVFRPAGMPPPAVFLIGLLLDLLGYYPLGVGVLTALAVHGVAIRARRRLARQGFAAMWLMFIAVAVPSAGLGWALTTILTFRLMPPGPAVFQAVLSSALYPALAIPLAAAHRSIADPERA
jgi:rod shape-determining protein MreD